MNATAGSELCDNCKLENLHRNYGLNETDCFSLFNEFLEMGNLLALRLITFFSKTHAQHHKESRKMHKNTTFLLLSPK